MVRRIASTLGLVLVAACAYGQLVPGYLHYIPAVQTTPETAPAPSPPAKPEANYDTRVGARVFFTMLRSVLSRLLHSTT